MKHVDLYTDGACSGNPGPGGYGAILVCEGRERELSGGFAHTTNNRMELLGAICGLETLRYPCEVTLCTDSRYLADALTKGWAQKWRANGWMRNAKEKALNVDLWERLLVQMERHQVKIVWVKGHAGHVYNERCDRLAVAAGKAAADGQT